jgi:AraC-like DNA-binding protein
MRFDEFIGFKLDAGLRVSLAGVRDHPFHLHGDVLELIFVLYGAVHISDCAKDHWLFPGDVYVFNPKDPHRIQSPESCAVLTLHLSRAAFAERFPALRSQYFISWSHAGVRRGTEPGADVLRFLAARAWQEYSRRSPGGAVLSELGDQILEVLEEDYSAYKYMRSARGEVLLVGRPEDQHHSPSERRDYQVVDDIYRNFREKLTLSGFARQLYVSEAHLSRSIKKTIGLSFSDILSLARVEEAERLLFSTEKTVDDIADETGFANRKHLALQFRKWYGKTPTAFRKAIREERIGVRALWEEPVDLERANRVLEGWLEGHFLKNQPIVV